MHIFKSKFGIGDLVYLITDEFQAPRMVTGIKFYPGGMLYQLAGGTMATEHYEIEITDCANEALRLGIDSAKANIN